MVNCCFSDRIRFAKGRKLREKKKTLASIFLFFPHFLLSFQWQIPYNCGVIQLVFHTVSILKGVKFCHLVQREKCQYILSVKPVNVPPVLQKLLYGPETETLHFTMSDLSL